jgi:hypothetical protein
VSPQVNAGGDRGGAADNAGVIEFARSSRNNGGRVGSGGGRCQFLVLLRVGGMDDRGGNKWGRRCIEGNRRLGSEHAKQPACAPANPSTCRHLSLTQRASSVQEVITPVLCN